MKQFLRIAIVVLIMVAMGFGGYALFFKPANKDEVYLALSDVSELKLEDTYIDSLKNIDSTKFLPSGKYSAKYSKILKNYRGLLTISEDLTEIKIPRSADGDVNGEKVENTDGIKQYTYPELKSKLDDIFNYYLAYSQAVSKKIPKSTLKNINKLIKSYESSFGNLVESINSIKSLQTFINEETEKKDYSSELEKRYQASIVSFRTYITDYVSLIQGAKDFVSEYVFNGEMITDKESLLQDLMLESIKKATSQAYGFSVNEQLNTADDYMKSATQITTLATDSTAQANLTNVYEYAKNTVLYGNKLYFPKQLEYYKVNLRLRLVENTLYFGDTDIVAKDGVSVEMNEVIVPLTVGGEIRKQCVNSGGNKYVDFVCYVKDDDKKIYFYDADDEYCASEMYITFDKNIEISGSQVIFGDNNVSVSYTYDKIVKSYFEIAIGLSINKYKIDNGKVVSVVDNSTQLSGATYNVSNLYSKTNYSVSDEGAKESLNYKKMVKCYNRIMNEDASVFARIIELSTSQKVEFVKGDMSVRASFVEILHDDIEYLLACCGFYE